LISVIDGGGCCFGGRGNGGELVDDVFPSNGN